MLKRPQSRPPRLDSPLRKWSEYLALHLHPPWGPRVCSVPSRSSWQRLQSFWPTYLYSFDDGPEILGGEEARCLSQGAGTELILLGLNVESIFFFREVVFGRCIWVMFFRESSTVTNCLKLWDVSRGLLKVESFVGVFCVLAFLVCVVSFGLVMLVLLVCWILVKSEFG